MSRALCTLLDLAELCRGYFTTAQAAERGVSRRVLSYYVRHGALERVQRGVYRVVVCARHQYEPVLVACLWAGAPVAASHETALVVHGVLDGDVDPVHVTVDHRFSGRSARIQVHRKALPNADVTRRDGLAVTTVERAFRDLARVVDPATMRPLIVTALDRRALTHDRLRRLAQGCPAIATAALEPLLRANRSVGLTHA